MVGTRKRIIALGTGTSKTIGTAPLPMVGPVLADRLTIGTDLAGMAVGMLDRDRLILGTVVHKTIGTGHQITGTVRTAPMVVRKTIGTVQIGQMTVLRTIGTVPTGLTTVLGTIGTVPTGQMTVLRTIGTVPTGQMTVRMI